VTARFVWALVGGLAVLVLLPRPEPRIDFDRVIVHREAIERLEPDTVVRFVERIRWLTPPPISIAVAPGGGAEDVQAFCRPALALERGDSTPQAPTLLLRSGSLERGWPLIGGPDELRLTGPTSTGDLTSRLYRTRGSVSFVTVGDSVIVRSDRWARAKDVLTAAGLLLLGRETGRIF